MLKTKLRRHFEQLYPSRELASWFDPLGMELDGNTARVFFPHPLFRQWFMGSIRPAFEEQAGKVIKGLRFDYRDAGQESRQDAEKTTKHGDEQKSYEQSYKQPQKKIAEQPQAFQETVTPEKSSYEQKNKQGYEQQSDRQPRNDGFVSTLLGRYSFDDFLVNRKNDFPLAAAKEAVVNAAKPLYTPLVIYGQSGSGKTHLLGAMANALLSEHPDLPFFYGNADMLQTRVLPGSLVPLDEKVVFMDDAERICSNRQLQDELTLVVDMFRAENRLLVLAFDAHPSTCAGLCQKLLSRLTGGLVLEVKKPDIDIRRQYVQQKNSRLNLGLSREQILSLAQRYQDFRTIDGALTRLKAYRSLVDRPEADVSGILGPVGEHKLLTPAIVVKHAAALFSLTPEEITGKSRDKKATFARQLSMYLCREQLGLSLAQVGNVFGGRDHSSVHYTLKKVVELLRSNKDTNKQLTALKQLCLSGPS